MTLQRTLAVSILLILGFITGTARATPESDFWRWFQRHQDSLFDFERDQERNFDMLESEMHKVHPKLTFEFGPKDGNQREFVISADGIREAFPKVESLWAAAPPLPRWRLVKFRPRREPMDLEYKGVRAKVDTVSVLLQPDGRKIGLTLFIPGYTKAAHQTYAGLAFLFLDQALGEFDVETRVGIVRVQEPSAGTASARTLSQLPAAFDDMRSR